MSFCHNFDEKKKLTSVRAIVWSLHVLHTGCCCVSFLCVLGLPPTSQRCAWEPNW